MKKNDQALALAVNKVMEIGTMREIGLDHGPDDFFVLRFQDQSFPGIDCKVHRFEIDDEIPIFISVRPTNLAVLTSTYPIFSHGD